MKNRVRSIGVVLALWIAWGSSPAHVQTAFIDDAGRSVQVPARVNRVFAAGGPAEVMLYTLVPDRLVGRNRVPEGDALEFFPPAYRKPTPIRQLPEVDNPAADAELIALKPDLYVDYGTVHADYIEAVAAVQKRTSVPGLILSGELARVPEMYRRMGAAVGASDRGQRLAATAEKLLLKYRGILGSSGPPVRVYLACSNDGYLPCLEDEVAGEQLRWLGSTNVAGTRARAPRRPLTIDEIKALAPQVLLVPGAASRIRADSAWKTVEAVAAGRVYQWPALPYNWGGRPPSVNRLPGVAWLAYVARGRTFDTEFEADIRTFFNDFYHLDLTEVQMRKLLAQS